MTTDQVQAVTAIVNTVLTLVLVVFAGWAAYTGVQTMKASQDASKAAMFAAEEARAANEQARLDSIEQTRPYVYVEILPSLVGLEGWDVRIANAGRSAARDLTLDHDSWPQQLDDVATSVQTLLRTARCLPPGSSIRALWRLQAGQGGRFDDGTTAAGMPRTGTITARYTSDDPGAPTYSDTFDVMIDNAGLWPVPESGPSPQHVRGQAREFYRLGQALVRRIGELSR